eukprot:2162455-Prymnesium_polylepis.1
MLRDVQQVDDPTFFTSILAMTGQLCAAVVAVPSGRLSDRLGRKPLVFASCALMAVRCARRTSFLRGTFLRQSLPLRV